MKIAILQYAPQHLDLDASLSKAKQLISEAAKIKVDLAVFGEGWFSGYPAWLDHCTNIAFWNDPPMKKVYARMIENSLQRTSESMSELCALASEHEIGLVIGANEYEPSTAKGTLYNSVFIINEKGEIANHHRKLVPTFTERLLHAHGDGQGLHAAEIKGAKVTASICWEHWMPLTRQSLHDTGEEIHVALWPKVHEMHQVASRQYAFEARCFVLAAGQIMHSDNFPPELEKKPEIQEEGRLVLNGGSCVIGPDGFYIKEPDFDREVMVTADLELGRIKEESLNLDVSGHYQRGDVFEFSVNRSRRGER